MKIQNHKNAHKRLFIISSVLVLGLAVGAGAYFLIYRESAPQAIPRDVNKVDYSEPTTEQKDAGDQIKQETIQKDQKKNTAIKDSSTPSRLPVTLTSSTVEGDIAYIRVEIDGIYDTGTCTLSLTQGSKTITKTAGIQALPQSSTCKGFNVPVSELDNGTWDINLQVSTGQRSGSVTGKLAV